MAGRFCEKIWGEQGICILIKFKVNLRKTKTQMIVTSDSVVSIQSFKTLVKHWMNVSLKIWFIFLGVFLGATINSASAQQGNAKYYDDDGFSDQKNMISLDVISLYKPLIPIGYERMITDNFSLFTEVAYMLIDHNYSFLSEDMYHPQIHKYIPGSIPFRCSGGFKLWGDHAPNSIFTQLGYRYWKFEDARFHDALFGLGYSKLIGNHFFLRTSANLGFRWIKYFDIKYDPIANSHTGSNYEDDYYDETHSILPFAKIEFSAGYFF